MTASVITSSIGRKELRQCIESVRAQNFPCKHYVYVNGERFHDSARETLKDFPDVTAIYLPEETGDYGVGPSMADVFIAALYLTKAEWIFYLNDDDFYDSNHVSSVMAHAQTHDLKWVYTLRKFVDIDGNFICDDDWSSLGFWPCQGKADDFLVDNSCFAVTRELAIKASFAWRLVPYCADRAFLAALKQTGEKYGSTGLSTVNYRVGTGTAQFPREVYLQDSIMMREAYPAGFPWRKPSVFSPGETPRGT